MSLTLRAPADADAAALSQLLGQLGYPAPPADVPRRLAALRQSGPGAAAYVAELDGRVIGVITGHTIASIHSETMVAMLTVLVVAESARDKGVGRALVARIEEWAREHGAVKISLTSALHREEAHRFYEGIGYSKSGVRLTKTLAPS